MTTSERYCAKASAALERANEMTTPLLRAEYRLLACEWFAMARIAAAQTGPGPDLLLD
jgi:hypothetical protein